MGAFLEKPKTEKFSEIGAGNGLRFGISNMQGWRVEMEDAHSAVTGLPGHLSKWSYFAVFDGHAGAKVSACCAEQLLNTVLETDDFKQIQPEVAPPLTAVRKGIRQGFLDLDARMRDTLENGVGLDRSGSTAVCVLVSPQHLFFANCGDSRSLLIRQNRVTFSTQDHKPGNPAERDRIQKAGGSVMIQRVNGSLAVSRSLGDFEYKTCEGRSATEQQVSPEPEVDVIDRQEGDQLMVLACDGVWDVMSNEQLCEFVLHRLRVHDNLSTVCNEVIDTCLYKGSRDNMSVVIVAFDGAPKPDPKAIEEDRRLNKTIEDKIKNYIEQSPVYNVNSVIQQLAAENLEGLPPGGGLTAKRTLIDQIFHKLTVDYSLGDNKCEDMNHINESSSS